MAWEDGETKVGETRNDSGEPAMNPGDDLEMIALGECVRVLNPLGPDQLRRVFSYLGRRYLDGLEEQLNELEREKARVLKMRDAAAY